MLPETIWTLFERDLFSIPSSDRIFNPYRDRHPDFDRPDAVAIRRANLRAYLNRYQRTPRLALIAEAPGPWGCRFSGVPLTSEAQLCDPSFPISGRPSGLADEPHREYSGAIVWDVVQPHFPDVFIWNSVPLQPHKPGEPLTIRTPGTREVMAYAGLLDALLGLLRPGHTVAVGRKAELSLTHLGRACTYVRHPSQGGASKFRNGMADLLAATA